jgi:protein-tyrosine phosphatase
MIRSIAKVALPRRAAQLLRDLRRVEAGARLTYLRLVWQGRRERGRQHVVSSSRPARLVAVCHGNILRSAYAEALLKQPAVAARVPWLRVSSAGLHAVPGRPADPRGVSVAREGALDMSAHRATQLSAPLVTDADLVLVMDYVNAAEVATRFPEAAGKVVLLGRFDPDFTGDPAIPDPFTGDLEAVRTSYSRVAAAIGGLVARLSRDDSPSP